LKNEVEVGGGDSIQIETKLIFLINQSILRVQFQEINPIELIEIYLKGGSLPTNICLYASVKD
jgi:hypothetical protein